MKKLNVILANNAFVPDYRAQEANANRFIGREPLPPFLQTKEPISLDSRPEYLAHIRQGDLKPLDKETANLAGLFY